MNPPACYHTDQVHIGVCIIIVSKHSDASLEIIQKRKCLFNNALNTYYSWLYDVKHMVKDHSDNKKKKPTATISWASLAAMDVLYAPFYRQYYITQFFLMLVVEHWLE